MRIEARAFAPDGRLVETRTLGPFAEVAVNGQTITADGKVIAQMLYDQGFSMYCIGDPDCLDGEDWEFKFLEGGERE